MSDSEIITIESKDQLKDAVEKAPVFVLFATVEGRDAVNASAQEEFNECVTQPYPTSYQSKLL